MSELPVDDVTATWWAATRERRLVVQHCARCARWQHYPRAMCTRCGTSDQLDFAAVAGTGSVDSYTEIRRAPSPEVTVPYVLARIRLDEGPVLLSVVPNGVGQDGLIGRWVSLTWSPLPDGRNLPMFALKDRT